MHLEMHAFLVAAMHLEMHAFPDAAYIRNGIMPHLWDINLSHIYAREVRWYFEFNSW
jgi:hypothetical protein